MANQTLLYKLDAWHKTKQGYVVFGLAELLLFVAFASLAIDRGTWVWYVLTLIFLIGAGQNFVRLAKTIKRIYG